MKGWNSLFSSKSKDPFASMFAERGNFYVGLLRIKLNALPENRCGQAAP